MRCLKNSQKQQKKADIREYLTIFAWNISSTINRLKSRRLIVCHSKMVSQFIDESLQLLDFI